MYIRRRENSANLLTSSKLSIYTKTHTTDPIGAYKVFDHSLSVKDSRKCLLARLPEVSVEVSASQAAPVVAQDDTVWIEHWHDFEHKSTTEFLQHRQRERCDVVNYL